MASSHRLLYDLYRAPFLIADPGPTLQTIAIDRDRAFCPMTSVGAEARTLAPPTKASLQCTIMHSVYAGAITLTVTGGYNQGGDTTIVLGTAGDWVHFLSVKVGASFYWRVIQQEGTDAITSNSLVRQSDAPQVIANGNTAITAAQLMNGYLTMASATNPAAPTVPTGTDMNTQLPVGYSLDWSFNNLGNQTVTLTAAAGHTLVGLMILTTTVTASFRTRVSAANTAITYRTG